MPHFRLGCAPYGERLSFGALVRGATLSLKREAQNANELDLEFRACDVGLGESSGAAQRGSCIDAKAHLARGLP
jgi:hypothetical protein